MITNCSLGNRLSCLKLFDDKQFEGIRERAESAVIAAETFVKEGEPHEIIVELANDKNADVIFMGSHGRTGITRILMGAVTERVIGKSSCPVLVVRM